MDVRVINKDGELVNVTNMSMRVMGNILVGYNVEQNLTTVARCESEKEARGVLEVIIGRIKRNVKGNVVVDLREGKER